MKYSRSVLALVDESLPRDLAAITGHDVATVQQQGWAGQKNGELSKLVRVGGFTVLLTADRNIEHQPTIQLSLA